ncbi:hypothetical protein NDN08_006758 [Rhodosorus marinus]|uniref:CBS domain-containing protein n=1 Tax=Rhodosorus marinus TaxID=101924 RepID=A0AAV8UNY6_9RHOD|nr:hypothetical protein NDN08_006758 [Rhodosorus marinus]
MVLSEDDVRAETELWSSMTCGELIKQQNAIVINADESVEGACEILLKNNILSAPVENLEKKQLIGVFTYRTLVESLVAKLPQNKRPQELNMSDLLHSVGPKVPVATIVERTFSSVLPSDTLTMPVRQFGNRIHRTAVVAEHGEFEGMLSQGLLLGFLQANLPKLKGVMSRSLKDLGMVKGTVLAVAHDSLVIEGVKLLLQKNISSVAITNARNAIIGALSLSDVKWILRKRHYHFFWLEVDKFLGHVKREEAFSSDNQARDTYPVFTVGSSRSLGEAVEKLVALRTHRLWIVENSMSPSGVISITDIMKLLTPPE